MEMDNLMFDPFAMDSNSGEDDFDAEDRRNMTAHPDGGYMMRRFLKSDRYF